MGRVRVRDFYQLAKALEALGRDLDKGASQALYKTAVWGVREARRVSAETSPRPKATGTYEQSFRAQRIRGGGRIYNTAPYSRWVERGRKPGKGPPLDAIMRWVKVKKLVTKGRARARRQEIRSIAFLIQRKIARDGIKGRYVLQRTMVKVRRKAKDELRALIARTAANPPVS